MSDWLDPLRATLAQRSTRRAMFFRDDDGGWSDDRLLLLLDRFATAGVPVDVATIPEALSDATAGRLIERAVATGDTIRLHQHGRTHDNHEPTGRKCEFGPSRDPHRVAADIAAGRQRLQERLGAFVDPIFTPPWNRCTAATARVVRDLGFVALSRDAGAPWFGIDGLTEVPVHVDWVRHARKGMLGSVLAAAACDDAPLGIMLHHAVMDDAELHRLAAFLTLVRGHANVACVSMRALLAAPR